MGQVRLHRADTSGFHNRACGPRPMVVTRAKPYFVSHFRGVLVHRVRSARFYLHTADSWTSRNDGKPVGYLAVDLWCGPSRTKGDLMDDPGDGVVCATCEGRAVGVGLPSSVLLVLRPVRYSPRKVR